MGDLYLLNALTISFFILLFLYFKDILDLYREIFLFNELQSDLLSPNGELKLQTVLNTVFTSDYAPIRKI
jgi:hypothetical protein